MSEEQRKIPPRKVPDIALNYILAGKWDVVDQRTWNRYCKDFSMLPFEQRTDIEAAEKRILGTKVEGLDLTWELYDPIKTVSEYADQKAKGNQTSENSKEIPYESLIRTGDAPLYGESQFFSQPIRKIIYNSNEPGSKELSSVFYLNGLKIPLDDDGNQSKEENGKYFAEYVIQHYDSYQKILIEYRLDIHSIMLRLFSVGVMTLSIHTENVTSIRSFRMVGNSWQKMDEQEPIEKTFCNCGSIGRRMYQPFINGHGNDNGCIETAVYSCIRFYEHKEKNQGGTQIPICYNRDAYPCSLDELEKMELLTPIAPYKAGKHEKFAHPNSLCFLEKLFNGKCISFERWHELPKKSGNRERIVITPFHDDRMYVHGYFIDEDICGLPTELKKAYPLREEILKGLENDKDHRQNLLKKWYAVLQLDRNCIANCHDLEMIRSQLERDTYTRWLGWGTLYGLTSTTFVMALNSSSEDYLIDNMQWHYFQLFLVALLQRCSTMRFYEEAAAIMNQSIQDKDVPKLCDSLRSQYIIFLNSVWWKEISLQIQGQEMYRMLSANMEIDDNVKQLDEALSELYEYNEGVYQKKISNAMNLFAVVGSVWAIIELLGFIHKGVTGDDPNLRIISNFCLGFWGKAGDFILWFLVSGIITYLLYWMINKKKSLFKRKGKKYSRRRK